MVSVQTYDELAALLSHNLNFNPETQASVPRQQPSQYLDPIAAPSATQHIVYSISQHYNHSAHVKPQEEPERPSSEPPQSESMSSEHILRIHGVDPATLTPSQLQLFRIAESPQQRRLIELWSICPPSNGGDIPALAWSSTTLQQEEQLARVRYERLQQDQTMSLDGTPVHTENGQWHQQEATSDPEPYITSGYEELMRRERERQNQPPTYNQATDPVYMGSCYNTQEQQQMQMASQYGAFEHFRGYGQIDSVDMMM